MNTVKSSKAPEAIGPYSQAVVANGFCFVSGQIGVGEGVTTIEEETLRALQYMEAILAEAGLSKENVVKTTVLLTTMDDYARVNAVYADFFGSHKPARAAFAVVGLPKGAHVEIEAVACMT